MQSTTGGKLVESWLDRQTEKRYQSALLQLLIAEGWTILHNTRHNALEFGKDIIARDPSGALVAMQLKGNPGSRLTKAQAQAMLPQVLELLEVPVPENYMDAPEEKHVSIIVTNGEVEEESVVEFDKIGLRTRNPLSASSSLKVWARGNLLSRFNEQIREVWPTSVEGIRLILETQSADGRSLIDPIKLADILTSSVGLPNENMRSPEKSSKLSAALVLGEVIKGPWYITENHYGLYQISVLISVFCMRYGQDVNLRPLLTAYFEVIKKHSRDLLNEAKKLQFDARYIWSERSPLDEVDIMKERLRLIADACSSLVISGEELIAEDRLYISELLRNGVPSGSIWGEGAIPSLILRYWAWRRLDATISPDQLLRGALVALVRAAVTEELAPPAPYYDFEECLYLHSNGTIGTESDIEEDSRHLRSRFAMTLMLMLAKRNWKQTCKNTWRPFSKILHESVELPVNDFFDARLSKNGRAVTTPLYSAEWKALVAKAIFEETDFPEHCDEAAWVMAAYIALVPYRAWQGVVMWLDGRLSETWYAKGRLPS